MMSCHQPSFVSYLYIWLQYHSFQDATLLFRNRDHQLNKVWDDLCLNARKYSTDTNSSLFYITFATQIYIYFWMKIFLPVFFSTFQCRNKFVKLYLSKISNPWELNTYRYWHSEQKWGQLPKQSGLPVSCSHWLNIDIHTSVSCLLSSSSLYVEKWK